MSIIINKRKGNLVLRQECTNMCAWTEKKRKKRIASCSELSLKAYSHTHNKLVCDQKDYHFISSALLFDWHGEGGSGVHICISACCAAKKFLFFFQVKSNIPSRQAFCDHILLWFASPTSHSKSHIFQKE